MARVTRTAYPGYINRYEIRDDLRCGVEWLQNRIAEYAQKGVIEDGLIEKRDLPDFEMMGDEKVRYNNNFSMTLEEYKMVRPMLVVKNDKLQADREEMAKRRDRMSDSQRERLKRQRAAAQAAMFGPKKPQAQAEPKSAHQEWVETVTRDRL